MTDRLRQLAAEIDASERRIKAMLKPIRAYCLSPGIECPRCGGWASEPPPAGDERSEYLICGDCGALVEKP